MRNIIVAGLLLLPIPAMAQEAPDKFNQALSDVTAHVRAEAISHADTLRAMGEAIEAAKAEISALKTQLAAAEVKAKPANKPK